MLSIELQMFRDAQRPEWWPLERWHKSQLDRTLPVLHQIYEPLRKRWQAMQRALKERQP